MSSKQSMSLQRAPAVKVPTAPGLCEQEQNWWMVQSDHKEEQWSKSRWSQRMFSLEKGLWGDLIVAFQYLKGSYKKDGEGLFTWIDNEKTRGNGLKCKEDRFGLDIGRKFFTVRVVRHRNRLPREAVDAPSSEVFKARLGGASANLL